MVGIIAILVILILCATVLLGLYLYYCSENNTGLFVDPKYNSTLGELKESIEDLTYEIEELKQKL